MSFASLIPEAAQNAIYGRRRRATAGPEPSAGPSSPLRSHDLTTSWASTFSQQTVRSTRHRDSRRPAPGGSLLPPTVYQTKEQQPLGEVLRNAGRKALGGGIPGAAAMGLQVLTLMWLRTTVNYQYRYGLTTTQALKKLYAEGGVVRFYRGLGPALLQGPLSRFGDTAANAGVLALLDGHDSTRNLPVGIKTLAASASAGAFRSECPDVLSQHNCAPTRTPLKLYHPIFISVIALNISPFCTSNLYSHSLQFS